MEALASQPTSHNPKDGLADEQEVSNSLTQKEREAEGSEAVMASHNTVCIIQLTQLMLVT